MSRNAVKLGRPATRADLEALAKSLKGEIIGGVLYTQPRPHALHSRSNTALGRWVGGPYDFDADGPGGWWILVEPGIELPGSPEISPDLAGWRRERMPRLPALGSPIRSVPDWVCEVLSPSNRAYDRRHKFPYYAEIGVPWIWVIDPAARTVEVKNLVEGRWTEVAVFADDEVLCADPFPLAKVDLERLWGDVEQDDG